MIIPSNDNVINQFYIRDTYEGSFENTKWTIVSPSNGVGNLNTTEIDTLDLIKVDHTSYSNRIIKRNGIVQLNISIYIDESVDASSVLIEIPNSILKTSSQSAYFLAITGNNDTIKLYTNGTDTVTQIKNSDAIQNNSLLQFSITLISEE